MYFRTTYNENEADSNFALDEDQAKSKFSIKKGYFRVLLGHMG
jgi:hypothetical protein